METLEFLNKNDGGVVVVSEGDAHVLTENDTALVDSMFEHIAFNYTEAFDMLCFLYSRSELNYRHFRFLVVSRFIRCNFGRFDTQQWDIDASGRWSLEDVDCPLRSECKAEGIICRAKLTTGLSSRELEVVVLLAEGNTARQTAKHLCISEHTVNVHVQNILRKMGATNMKQVTTWYYENRNAIKPKMRECAQ